GQVSSLLQIREQLVTLRVNVRCGFVSDLGGGTAQANALVKDGGADPHQTTVGIDLVGVPETNVVAMPRIVAYGLFECQVLLATKEILTADGGILVGAIEDRGLGNLQRTSQGQWVGRIPLGRDHDFDHFGVAANQCYVDRVGRNAVCCVGDAGNVL